MAKKMNMHSGSHALQARQSDDGMLSLFQSIDPCAALDAELLDEDEDFRQVGDEHGPDDLLSALRAVLTPEADPKFQAFMSAIQAGNRELAIQLLHEHDVETNDGPNLDGTPATAEQEAAQVDEMIADQQAGAASNVG